MKDKIIAIGDGAKNIACTLDVDDNIVLISLGGRKGEGAIDVLHSLAERPAIVVLIMPMICEGVTRNRRAEECRRRIEAVVGEVVVFSNEAYAHLPLIEAFGATDNDVRGYLTVNSL